MGKIYTKKGDKGETKNLRGGMKKSDMLAQVLGSIDELNSWVGFCGGQELDAELEKVQKNLMGIASTLAGWEFGKDEQKDLRVRLAEGEVERMEILIDKMSVDLPELTSFIFPKGEGNAGKLHVARSVCRRVEREVVRYLAMEELNEYRVMEKEKILAFLNRLSDMLFVMARWVNLKRGGSEKMWR